MRVLFASGEPYLPGFRGGAEVSIDELARELLALGHDVEVVAKLGHGGARQRYRAWRVLTGRCRVGRRDGANGYPTWRAFPDEVRPAFAERLRAFRPDVVLTWNVLGGVLADDAAAAGIRALVWSPDVTMRWAEGGHPRHPDVGLLAVSEFVATRIRDRLGRPAGVLRPVVRMERYVAKARRPEHVTLVNPQSGKGVHLALEVARRLPHRTFLFVVPPGFPRSERVALDAGRRGLPHVIVRGPFADMRDAYALTRILLVPSLCEDASPRVVLEAHANGIPVVARAVGGIPEVSGGASLLLPPDAGADAWADAVEGLLTDPIAADDLARRGRENAAQSRWTPRAVVGAFLEHAGARAQASSVPAETPS